MYSTIQNVGVSKNCLTFIQQGCIKLTVKVKVKTFIHGTKYIYFK